MATRERAAPEIAGDARCRISAVAERTGLTAYVIRAWERRHGAVSPERTKSGVRLYSNADVLRLRLLRLLTGAGQSIGRVAHLPTEELLERAGADAWGTASTVVDDAERQWDGDGYRAECLAAVERLDGAALHAVLVRAAAALGLAKFISAVVIPVLHRTGELWDDGEICPAHEHLLTETVRRLLSRAADSLRPAPGASILVATTPSGQLHELGALLAALVAAEEGWRTVYLGPDLRSTDIAVAARQSRASVVALSVTLDAGAPTGAMLRALSDRLEPGTILVVGGRAVRVEDMKGSGALVLSDLDAFRNALRTLHPAARPRSADGRRAE